jgi:hypothetical protein
MVAKSQFCVCVRVRACVCVPFQILKILTDLNENWYILNVIKNPEIINT